MEVNKELEVLFQREVADACGIDPDPTTIAEAAALFVHRWGLTGFSLAWVIEQVYLMGIDTGQDLEHVVTE